MIINELLNEKYEKNHKCLTPGTIYTIELHNNHVDIRLDLPDDINEVKENKMEDLESELHYAIEKVIAKYYF